MSILPHTIEPHTEMDAVEVQDNFITLVDAITNLSSRIDGVATGVDAKLVNFKNNIDGNIDEKIGRFIDTYPIVEYFSDGVNWSMLYSNDFCVQGGIITATSGTTNITFPKAYRDMSYYVQVTDGGNGRISYGASRTNTAYFTAYGSGSGNVYYWEAKGFVA